jgi:hypothetical protein
MNTLQNVNKKFQINCLGTDYIPAKLVTKIHSYTTTIKHCNVLFLN